ncbi:MAG TPA: DUF2993 domain-containing protein [Cyanobacteria bacterium UBA8803]|nr:DUF2993 domain-containing protein [Cyanobacteria bacterium UBA9273]HBL58103.1 DUF2993 domain-containing protein [Cyanobacteria bacterium UBA8803]
MRRIASPKAPKLKKSQIISTVISPAVQLWLRSQVEQVEALQVRIASSDGQILSGQISTVSIAAIRAVYQGLHLSQIQLEGTDIRFNLGQVLKGKPLRLLAPIPVVGQVLLSESDLQASLQAPLLSNALNELLNTFLQSKGIANPANDLKDRQIDWQQINFDTSQLILSGILTDVTVGTTPIAIRAGLVMETPQVLQLNPLQIQIHPNHPAISLDGFRVDLGPEVDIQELTLTPEQLTCRGCLRVMP